MINCLGKTLFGLLCELFRELYQFVCELLSFLVLVVGWGLNCILMSIVFLYPPIMVQKIAERS